ncbi:MAG: peptidoglycan-binding protein [Candidatus Nomurabacteria bacterium]|nr:MAG: peptidoglycan-binding protein [Candidatus Nomurabacteria bacterium]
MLRLPSTRFWIISGLSMLIVLGAVIPARAEILPNCEKTLYKVELNGDLDCPDGTNNCIDPNDYIQTVHGDIEQVMVNRSCGFNDFIQLFVNLANWGLAIMGALAVFFYMYAGFQFLTAGGRSENVEQGKKILWGTTMGVIIMLTAWAVIGFYIVATTGSNQGFVFPNDPNFLAPWFGQTETCRQTYIKNYDQSQCGQNNLHINCSDPIDGSDGPVTRLQSILTQRACNPGGIDGCFGSNTESGLRQFQRVNWRSGIIEDGVVNADDWSTLLNTSTAYDCSVPLGCCINPDEPSLCYDQIPEAYCNQNGWTFLPDSCASYDFDCEGPS